MDDLAIDPFLTGLPKVELHIHIEGTLSPALRWKLSQRNNVPLKYQSYEELAGSYATTYNHRPELIKNNWPTFFEAYFGGMEVLRTEEDFYELAMELFARYKELNVRYVEPFFDLQAHTRRGVPVDDVCNGFLRAQKDGVEKYNVHSQWIMTIVRDDPVEEAMAAYEASRAWSTIPSGKGLWHAVGVASNEYDRPPTLFEDIFRKAKSDGLKVTMHCDFDQKDNLEHIQQCIFEVCDGEGADRIDHGLNASESRDLIQGLKDRNIGLTLCPHAYHRRTPTEVLFPKIRKLWDEGVTFCINSDDPSYMHQVWIDGAMQKAMTYCDLSRPGMVNLAKTGVHMSWAPEEVKKRILAEIMAYSEQ